MSQSTLIEMPYGDETIRFHVPSSRLMGVYAPHDMPPVDDIVAEVRRALAEPIGGPSLVDLARGAGRVVLVADDNTRPTPAHVIIPEMLNALNKAGVSDAAVQILIALGTHRPMTAAEIEAKFGLEVMARVEIVNHDAFDPAVLLDLGTTPGGVSVQVNRAVMEADLVLGVGSIVPHHIPGYSGGAKIIQPGVCGETTTGQVHLLSVRQGSLLGILENTVRAEMEAIADRAGLRAIVNTILDRHGRMVGVVYGDPWQAFRQGAALSRRVYGVEMPARADIVIAGSHPCDIEFWQAHKTLYAAERCVKEGGTIIVVTPCPEGVSVMHGEMVEFTARSVAEIDAAVRSGEITDLTAGALAIAIAGARQHAPVSIVSDGICDADARGLGFTSFRSVDAALEDALARHGADATIAVLPYAPDTLPIVP
ncbi:MAG: nickel-dependent lactate racemase [Anaerolineae bacterium]|jgi:nickel-dependent lactate racemase